MGFTWEKLQELNPRMILASVKGFGPGPYEDCKVYENVAQCAGGSASTTGFDDGPPMVTGAVNIALWSIGCRSEPALIMMPVGSICAWQSLHSVVGWANGVMVPPGVAE